jgi:hypothetical protein
MMNLTIKNATMISTHVLDKRGRGVRRPADGL